MQEIFIVIDRTLVRLGHQVYQTQISFGCLTVEDRDPWEDTRRYGENGQRRWAARATYHHRTADQRTDRNRCPFTPSQRCYYYYYFFVISVP
jgi:hypothetical protein